MCEVIEPKSKRPLQSYTCLLYTEVKTDSPTFYKPPTRFTEGKTNLYKLPARFAEVKPVSPKLYKPPTLYGRENGLSYVLYVSQNGLTEVIQPSYTFLRK